MNPIDLIVIAIYVSGCTALGAWLGSKSQGLKGYFLAESDIPAWAVMISIVATETSTATFLSVPGVGYQGDFTLLQLPWWRPYSCLPIFAGRYLPLINC
jgi:solute:Na+ symporter, SSS family